MALPRNIHLVFEPLIRLGTNNAFGYEAQLRFRSNPYRNALALFLTGQSLVNKSMPLDIYCLQAIDTELLSNWPNSTTLAVTVRAATLRDGSLQRLLTRLSIPLSQVVVEIDQGILKLPLLPSVEDSIRFAYLATDLVNNNHASDCQTSEDLAKLSPRWMIVNCLVPRNVQTQAELVESSPA